MPRYLITPSLHSSWRFYHLLEPKTKQDFLDVLNKKEVEPTPDMLAGSRFEADIEAICKGGAQSDAMSDQAYARCVHEIADYVRGGLWQERVMKDVRLLGMDFLLYGKADVIKRKTIFDIKWTSNYDVGKYLDSVQHPLYLECSGLPEFAYLVSDGKSVWREDYHIDDDTLPALRGELATMIENIMADAEFRSAYLANWETYPDRGANAA